MFNNIDVETTDEKVQALLDYLNGENDTKLTADDIKVEEQSYSKSGALYHTPFGTYNVLTDSESYDAAYQRINDIWNDLGLESFTPNAQIYIRDNFIEPTDSLDEFMENGFREYYEDIENESDDTFDDRLMQELAEIDGFDRSDMKYLNELKEELEELKEQADDLDNRIYDYRDKLDNASVKTAEIIQSRIDALLDRSDIVRNEIKAVEEEIDDNDLNKWLDIYDENKYELIDKATEKKIDEWNNSLEWYLEEFGKDTINYLLNNGLAEVNMDELVDYIIDTDGRGSNLAGWDGNEIEQDDFYIYKQDNFIYECDKSDKEEECEMAD